MPTVGDVPAGLPSFGWPIWLGAGCIYLYIYMYVFIYVFIYISLSLYRCKCIYIFIICQRWATSPLDYRLSHGRFGWVCIYIHICIYTLVYVYICINMYTCIHFFFLYTKHAHGGRRSGWPTVSSHCHSDLVCIYTFNKYIYLSFSLSIYISIYTYHAYGRRRARRTTVVCVAYQTRSVYLSIDLSISIYIYIQTYIDMLYKYGVPRMPTVGDVPAGLPSFGWPIRMGIYLSFYLSIGLTLTLTLDR